MNYIIKSILLFLLVITIISCKSTHPITFSTHDNVTQMDFINVENKYRILKIKVLEDKVYVIYAQKGDSVYKIVSEKEKYPSILCNSIKEDIIISLNLMKIFPQKSLFGIEPSGSFYSAVKGLNINGVIVEVDDSSNNSLYSADNLKGLCIIEKEDEILN